ncbi:MAG: hypothetical protein HYZ52_07140 [Candidatus Omnitrophica bacterium]|nr:hypothetical protein [Candidatus Omnitrophota bacterium]
MKNLSIPYWSRVNLPPWDVVRYASSGVRYIGILVIIFVYGCATSPSYGPSVPQPPPTANEYFVCPGDGDGLFDMGASIWWTKMQRIHNRRNFISPDDLTVVWGAQYSFYIVAPTLEVVWYAPDGSEFSRTKDTRLPYAYYNRAFIRTDDAMLNGQLGRWRVEAYADSKLMDTRYFFIDYTENLRKLPIQELSGVKSAEELQLAIDDIEKNARPRVWTTASKDAFMKAAQEVLVEKGFEVKAADSVAGTIVSEFVKKDFHGIKSVLAVVVGARNYELGLRYRYEVREKGNFIADLSVGRYISDKGISEFRAEQMGEFQKELKDIVQAIKERAESNAVAVSPTP